VATTRASIQMNDAELRTLYDEVRTIALGTVGRDGSPHLSAMWFARLDGKISFWSYTTAQKTVNLGRDRRVSCLFEAGEAYDELRGALVRGRAVLFDDYGDALRIGAAVAMRYNPGIDQEAAERVAARQAAKRTGIQVDIEDIVSWDHRKLG